MANDHNSLEHISTDSSQIVLYQPDETISLEVKLDVNYDTVWLNQQQMAELYGTKRQAITKHIANIYDCQELQRISTSSILEQVRQEGNRKVTRKIEYYNLDMIISVGYRVNTKQGIAFRQWATSVLKEYLLRGYSINRQLIALQERTDERFIDLQQQLDEQKDKVEFLVNIHTRPTENLFIGYGSHTVCCNQDRVHSRGGDKQIEIIMNPASRIMNLASFFCCPLFRKLHASKARRSVVFY